MQRRPARDLTRGPVLSDLTSRTGLVAAGTVALLLTGAAVAAPASAHDVLLDSEPGDGEVLEEVPEEVVLTFSADQLDLGAVIQVLDADETAWEDGDTVVDGDQVRVAVDPDIPSGDYTVQWRSVASDGHPITGTFAFGLDVPEPEETPAVEETVEEAPPAPEPTPTAEPSPEPEVVEEEGGGVLVPVLIGALVLAGVAGAFWWRRRSREPRP
ncbi:copper resistance CopC family protein [Cellulomonas bogoriensis]|uniref:Copper resistance protein CopC n=1 Tax=Cellulomonas bogoriensis 69B4 = DSM 16987 TaxID=1386082 RepID=A0A0A0C171_9CELL|nr:copper resistance CopC family protein [Cellulomonas bogoriensis]KGM13134.1 copper resistance protein CopC [Cellulomonas bogoriensis 69B4 = DSM 16987]